MSQFILKTRNAPRRSVPPPRGHAFQQPNSVRMYRDTPESVYLQIRLNGQFVGVALTFAEARDLGRAMIAETWPNEKEA